MRSRYDVWFYKTSTTGNNHYFILFSVPYSSLEPRKKRSKQVREMTAYGSSSDEESSECHSQEDPKHLSCPGHSRVSTRSRRAAAKANSIYTNSNDTDVSTIATTATITPLKAANDLESLLEASLPTMACNTPQTLHSLQSPPLVYRGSPLLPHASPPPEVVMHLFDEVHRVKDLVSQLFGHLQAMQTRLHTLEQKMGEAKP